MAKKKTLTILTGRNEGNDNRLTRSCHIVISIKYDSDAAVENLLNI